MKKILLFILILAFVSCNKDIEDIGKCLYNNPKIKEIAGEIMKAIINKDFSQLLPKLKEFFPEAIDIIMQCLKIEEDLSEDNKSIIVRGADNCVWSCKKYDKKPKSCCKNKCGKSC